MSSVARRKTERHQGPGREIWRFSDILKDETIKDRWEKVRQYFFLRESTYDMTNRCNIRCDGCYYYEGEKQFAEENGSLAAWRDLMEREKARGITYVVLAGAEPSLVPERCEACYDVISLGAVASNGLKRIPADVAYRIHLSVWGNDQTSLRIRNAKHMLERQVDNYQGDERAIFVYTFTRENVEEIYDVMDFLSEKSCRVTFNIFSAPVGYSGSLRHDNTSLRRVRTAAMRVMRDYPDHVLFSPYNVSAHTNEYGLHDLYGCSYPRMNPSTAVGLGRSFRQYRADLTWDRDVSCCVPDTDCKDCRHYAAGSAVVTARLFRHAADPETFSAWLDYADTYLAVWVQGYEKGAALCEQLIDPPKKNASDA